MGLRDVFETLAFYFGLLMWYIGAPDLCLSVAFAGGGFDVFG